MRGSRDRRNGQEEIINTEKFAEINDTRRREEDRKIKIRGNSCDKGKRVGTERDRKGTSEER